ncbi:growth hormone receptor-like [Polypterus senegalus]|uniref:growth hormone receptor-like n=1 Tax=Polypterus senegalus TaxID=55291 RepID=UPI00196680AF|nr:growth hormone receptor-like [Polypterus senegalus]
MGVSLCLAAAVLTAVGHQCGSSNSSQDGRPFFTGCRSPQQETFTCWWDTGYYGNLSGTPAFKVFYSKSGCQELMLCPDYVTSGEDSCYFNETYTSVWTWYCLKIQVDTEQGSITSEPYYFNFLDILQPDPPVELAWFLLNNTNSEHYADVMISWMPPPSADVASGWISLQYQLRYRSTAWPKWKLGPLIHQTAMPLYALEFCQRYEVQVRCKPLAEGQFSSFSDSLTFDLVSRTDSSFLDGPLAFAAVTMAATLMCVVLFIFLLCHLDRVKEKILPNVPVPKIVGINMDSLQNGGSPDFGITFDYWNEISGRGLSEENWEDFMEVSPDVTSSSNSKHVAAAASPGLADTSDSGCDSINSAEVESLSDQDEKNSASCHSSSPAAHSLPRGLSLEHDVTPAALHTANAKSQKENDNKVPLVKYQSFCPSVLSLLPKRRRINQLLLHDRRKSIERSTGFYIQATHNLHQHRMTSTVSSDYIQGNLLLGLRGPCHTTSICSKQLQPESIMRPESTDMSFYVTL